MSEIHAKHTKSHGEKNFTNLMDLSDVNAKDAHLENFLLTRLV